MTTHRLRRRLIALLCALAVAAAACGSDGAGEDADDQSSAAADDSSQADGSEQTDSESDNESDGAAGADEADEGAVDQATGSPITIGLVFGGTGRTASAYGASDDVAAAWVEYWNANGGVDGRPVEVIAKDMEGDVAVAAEAVRELVESDGVVGIIIQDSATEAAVSEYLAEQGVPVIGGTANAFDPTSAPNTQFVVASTPPGSFGLTLAAAQADGRTHLSGIVCAEVPTCAAADPFFAENVAGFDLEYTPVVAATHQEASYTSFCLAATGDGADVISLSFAPAAIVPIAQECRAQGFDGAISLAANTIDAQALDAAGDLSVLGYLNGFPWWADDPQAELFRTAMASAAPDADFRTSAATNTWATLELMKLALTNTPPAGDDVTTEDVLAAYYAIDGETLDGLLPAPVTFTEGDGAQPGIPCGWLVSYADGEFTTLTVGETANGADGDLQSYCYAG